jgi:hypothetical protein
MEAKSTNQNGTITGSTTAAYVDVLTLYNVKGAIFNIGAVSTDLKYKITGYVSGNASCAASVVTAETTVVAAATTQDVATVLPYAKVVVSIKYSVGVGTYQVDFNAY